MELRSRLPSVSGLVRPHYHIDVCKSLVEGPSENTYMGDALQGTDVCLSATITLLHV